MAGRVWYMPGRADISTDVPTGTAARAAAAPEALCTHIY